MDLITDFGTNIDTMVFSIGFFLKIAFGLLFILYIAYSFFLALRVRILADTVVTPWNKTLERLAFFHLYAVILIGLLALSLIVMA
jgi:predicted PurR-regulated permease PerM